MSFKGLIYAAMGFSLLANISCSQYELFNLRNEIGNVSSNKIMLETKTKYKMAGYDNELENKLKGYGNVVGNFIITVDHVVSFNKFEEQTTFGTIEEYQIEKISEETTFNGERLEEIVNDSELDIAVFKLPENLKGKYQDIKMGDSDKLEVLDKVCLIGNPGLKEEIIKCDIIASKVIGVRETDIGNVYGFLTQILARTGDSGTPLVNEKGELIGLANAILNRYSVTNVVPINKFKEYMK